MANLNETTCPLLGISSLPDLKELLASAALEDEELAEKLDKEGADKLTFQKIEWKADEEAGGFERELVGIYV